MYYILYMYIYLMRQVYRKFRIFAGGSDCPYPQKYLINSWNISIETSYNSIWQSFKHISNEVSNVQIWAFLFWYWDQFPHSQNSWLDFFAVYAMIISFRDTNLLRKQGNKICQWLCLVFSNFVLDAAFKSVIC